MGLANLRCDNCGGELVRRDNSLYQCRHCLNEKTVREWGNEIDMMLDRALQMRLANGYDLAHEIYLDIIRRDPNCVDAYWGALLSKYGVEISSRTEFRPSLHKISEDRFTDEPLFRQLVNHKYVDGIASVEYKKMADEIELVRCEAIRTPKSQPKYDVFLSFKNKVSEDENSRLTDDRIIAERLYKKLTSLGYSVFFAPVTLKGKAGLVYEPIIYAALHSADTMILIGSKKEYLLSPWVANEWRRFKELVAQEKRKEGGRDLRLLVCHSDELNVRNLPDDLSRYQTINLDEKNGGKELIEKFPKKKSNAERGMQLQRERQAAMRAAERRERRAANAKRNKIIAIVLAAILALGGGGFGLFWIFRPIAVASVVITSNTIVGINEELELTANVLPTNATDRELTFRIDGQNTIGATIQGNIFRATQAGSVNVIAAAGGVDSQSVQKTVVFVDVESIAVTNENSFRVTQNLGTSI